MLPLPWLWGFSLASSYPFQVFTLGSNPPQGSFPAGALSFVGFNLNKAQLKYVQPNPPRDYAMNWNFNIQHEITPSLTAQIGFVGSHTVHAAVTPDDMNLILPTLTSAGYLWPCNKAFNPCTGQGSEFNPNTADMRPTVWDDTAFYSSLQVQVTKRMSHGFQAQGSYTWGQCIDQGSSGEVGDPYQNSITSPLWFDRASRQGLCDYNVGQNFVANYVWDVPTPKFGGAFAEHVLGGWEVGGIFTASTGTPYTLLMAGDPVGMLGDPWPFPDRLVGAGCTGNDVNPGNPNNFVKLNCFSPPIAPASFAAVCQPAAPSVAAVIPNTCMNLNGNAGRNQQVGPGLMDFDFSLFKNNYIKRISENFNVQFRAEFFNILNRANFQSPLDNLYLFNQDGTPVGGAGAIDATANASREIQFSLKVIW